MTIAMQPLSEGVRHLSKASRCARTSLIEQEKILT